MSRASVVLPAPIHGLDDGYPVVPDQPGVDHDEDGEDDQPQSPADLGEQCRGADAGHPHRGLGGETSRDAVRVVTAGASEKEYPMRAGITHRFAVEPNGDLLLACVNRGLKRLKFIGVS